MFGNSGFSHPTGFGNGFSQFNYLQQGDNYLDQGRYNDAINSYNEVIKNDPLNENVYCSRGNAFFKLKKFKEALQDFDRVLKLNNQNEKAYYLKAAALESLGKVEEVAYCYKQLLEINPHNQKVHALFAYNSGNYEEALVCCDKMLEQSLEEKKAEYADIYYYKASSLYHLKRYTEATKFFKQAVETDPNNAKLWNEYGLLWYSLKRHSDADYCYEKSIKLYDNMNPISFGGGGVIEKDLNAALAYYNRGNIYFDLCNYQTAMGYYKKALEINPKLAKAENGKGLIHYELGQYMESINSFNNATKIDPKYAEAYNNWAQILISQQEYEGVIRLYDYAIYADPNFSKTYMNKAKVLSVLWQKKEALACLDKAIEIDPQNMVLYSCNKAVEYSSLGNEEKAMECLKIAYDLASVGMLGNNLEGDEIKFINNLLVNYSEELSSKERQKSFVLEVVKEVLPIFKDAMKEIVNVFSHTIKGISSERNQDENFVEVKHSSGQDASVDFIPPVNILGGTSLQEISRAPEDTNADINNINGV